jgi:vitamin B12 transporter
LNIMIKLIIISLLLNQAVPPLSDTLTLEEIVFPGQASPEIYSSLARVVRTVDQTEIRSLPAGSIQDVLEHVTALDIRQRGSHGVQADVSMRGGSFEQVLILLNGVRINDPQTGHHNLNIPVNLADIERIEILQGPGSRIYGPNAFSGAINIITREPGGAGIMGSVSGGEYGFLDLHGAGSFGTGPLNHYISLGNASSDGFTGNTDFKNSTIYYRAGTDAGPGVLDLQAGYMEKGFGARNFYSALYPDQYEKIRSSFTNLTFRTRGRISYRQSFYHRRLHDRFELFRYEPASWYAGHNYHMTNIYGTTAALDIPHAYGNTYVGTELRSERILSSVLGERLDTPQPVRNEKDAFYRYSKNRKQFNLTAGNTIILGSFSASAGALLSKTGDDGWRLYGGIDAGYAFTGSLTWFSSWNQSVRVPSFTEMYYTSPVHRGNPLLIPEEASTIETGLRMGQRTWTGHVATFKRRGTNIIDWVKREDELTWESRNISTLDTWGAEIEAAWKNPGTGKFPFREVRAGYAYLDVTKQSEQYISAYVLDYLRHKFVTAISLSLHRNADLVITSIFQDRSGSYTDIGSGSEKPYDPFILTDLGLVYRFSGSTVFKAEITNLFNTSYNDIGNVPVPGRWIKAGVLFDFSLR